MSNDLVTKTFKTGERGCRRISRRFLLSAPPLHALASAAF
jgi:hypothetical protein